MYITTCGRFARRFQIFFFFFICVLLIIITSHQCVCVIKNEYGFVFQLCRVCRRRPRPPQVCKPLSYRPRRYTSLRPSSRVPSLSNNNLFFFFYHFYLVCFNPFPAFYYYFFFVRLFGFLLFSFSFDSVLFFCFFLVLFGKNSGKSFWNTCARVRMQHGGSYVCWSFVLFLFFFTCPI